MAGARDRRVTFHAPGAQGGRDAFNNPVPGDPVDLGEVYGDFTELNAREKVEAGQEVSARAGRLVVRSNPITRALTSTHSVTIGGETWAVTGAVPKGDGRRRSIVVSVTRKADV